jgi:glucose-6-phosphate isomerase
VEGITGKPAKQIMDAIYEGSKIAMGKAEVPYMEVLLDDLTEYSLGEFLQFKMIEMMYLGKLLNVNTFDQPNVEAYKIETKKILLGDNQ